MTFATVDAPASRDRTAIAGWVLSAIFALFMLGASAFPKLAGMAVATDTITDLGWPDVPVFWIGVMEAGFSLVFLWRRTALLGAMLMMGPLGDAMATQIRADSPLFSQGPFSIYLGVFMSGGLWLREPRLGTLLSLHA